VSFPEIRYTVKKPFCFSFPSENSLIKDRKFRCRYQNNLPDAYIVFIQYPMPEKLWPENPGQKLQIRLENLGFLVSGGKLFTFPHAGKVKAGKSQQVTTDMTGKSCGQ
jgi:hypothetical protein